jgi:putative component of membrane protein insertase Oxa1/YidC/SpoIIIJ protein YidD
MIVFTHQIQAHPSESSITKAHNFLSTFIPNTCCYFPSTVQLNFQKVYTNLFFQLGML